MVSKTELIKALQKTEASEKVKGMLRRHLDPESGNNATMTSVAVSAGYKDYRGGNSAYGHFAARLARHTTWSGKPLNMIMTFNRPGNVTNREWVLTLRPQFVEALEATKWLD